MGSSVADNAKGVLRLCAPDGCYTDIVSQSGYSHTFYLPNYDADMYAVHAGSNDVVGSGTNPVYIAAGGRATALTYTANRLYYSASTASFDATLHHASTEALAINWYANSNSTVYSDSYALYVNGTSYFNNAITINGNAVPTVGASTTTSTYSLGTSSARWASLYLGSSDTYGDAYTPVYWNAGVPAAVTPVQYCTFTIADGKSGVRLAHTAFVSDSYVLQLVVTSGESNLNSALTWTSAAGYIDVTCTAVTSGAVSGYMIVSRGGEIVPTATDIT